MSFAQFLWATIWEILTFPSSREESVCDSGCFVELAPVRTSPLQVSNKLHPPSSFGLFVHCFSFSRFLTETPQSVDVCTFTAGREVLLLWTVRPFSDCWVPLWKQFYAWKTNTKNRHFGKASTSVKCLPSRNTQKRALLDTLDSYWNSRKSWGVCVRTDATKHRARTTRDHRACPQPSQSKCHKLKESEHKQYSHRHSWRLFRTDSWCSGFNTSTTYWQRHQWHTLSRWSVDPS